MKALNIICIISLLWATSCACDGEKVFKALTWSMNKLAGDGYFPSQEILALGDFEGVEVNMQKRVEDGKNFNEVELKLINGKGPQMHQGEELLARHVAELYAKDYSKIQEYDVVKIIFIQTDPYNPDNLAITEYSFQVNDLIH